MLNTFYATGIFLTDVFRECRKRLVAWNGLMVFVFLKIYRRDLQNILAASWKAAINFGACRKAEITRKKNETISFLMRLFLVEKRVANLEEGS